VEDCGEEEGRCDVEDCGEEESTGRSIFLTNLSRDDWTLAFFFSS
jgi:hypothetical protein